MNTKKIGLGALALALSCLPALAQEEGPEGPGAPVAAEMIGPAGPADFAGDPGVDPAPPGDPRGMRGDRGRGGRGPERGGRGGHGFSLSRALSDPQIQQKVGVSADQVAKIRSQETAFRKTSIQQRADLQVKELDLRELVEADKPDRAAIDRKLQEISTSRLAIDKSRIDFRLNMKDALTPDQREKLKQALKDKWQAGAGERRRGAGGRGQGGYKPTPQPPGGGPSGE